ncbi:unnamed protein product [Discula destructiva]
MRPSTLLLPFAAAAVSAQGQDWTDPGNYFETASWDLGDGASAAWESLTAAGASLNSELSAAATSFNAQFTDAAAASRSAAISNALATATGAAASSLSEELGSLQTSLSARLSNLPTGVTATPTATGLTSNPAAPVRTAAVGLGALFGGAAVLANM